MSYPGAALPRSVQGIIYGKNHYGGVKNELIEWHGHDFYKVVTNASTAWLKEHPCELFIVGDWRKNRNCPLEAMVIEYASLKGTTDGMSIPAITELPNS